MRGAHRVLAPLGLVFTLLLGYAAFRAAAPDTIPVDAVAIRPPALNGVRTAPQGVARGAVAAGPAGQVEPDPRWVHRVGAEAGIPGPALRAYARASLRLTQEQPACHLGWTTLAGIGRVESGHGTFGGRVLDQSGRAATPVAGPALDGSSYAAIREGSTWARARGPLQFIPSTWRQWSADGDGDGVASVDDVDDAALAAGRYLCADGHDLATAAGWNAAVFSYNHSWDYVQLVYAGATTYNADAR